MRKLKLREGEHQPNIRHRQVAELGDKLRSLGCKNCSLCILAVRPPLCLLGFSKEAQSQQVNLKKQRSNVEPRLHPCSTLLPSPKAHNLLAFIEIRRGDVWMSAFAVGGTTQNCQG